MSLNINDVRIAGNLTRDPELKQLAGDKCVCNFGLAINRKFKGADGQVKEEVTFVDCEAWGRTAELVSQYLAKGSGAYCEGRLKQESWEDKDSGQKRYKMKIVVDNVQFTGAPKGKGNVGNVEPAPAADSFAKTARPAPAGRPAVPDDEPPF